MIRPSLWLALVCAVLATPAAAAEPPAGPVAALNATSSGQPIVAPTGPLQVNATIIDIPAGGATAVHRHPYPRYGYILSGRIAVINVETGQTTILSAGQATVDPIGQWHLGKALDGQPVRLLVFDSVPPGQANTTTEGAPPAP